MRDDVRKDLTISARHFKTLVWPVVQPLIEGELVPVEDVESKGMQKDLDTLAGIDAWQIWRAGGCMRGVASRVQEVYRSYDSFTIRHTRVSGAETEFSKRMKAISSGWLYPHLTIQAYVTQNPPHKLFSVGIINTVNLYAFVKRGLDFPNSNMISFERNGDDGNIFIVAYWKGIIASGAHMIRRPNPEIGMDLFLHNPAQCRARKSLTPLG